MAKQEVIKISTLIGAGTVCGGDLTVEGSARIDGTINGNVEVSGKLILGTAGVVNGDIKADSVQLGGEVNGDVEAPTHAELTGTAKVIGNLSTNVIVIDEHAIIQGAINMNQEVSEKRPKNAAYRRALKNSKKSAAAAVAEALKEVKEENSTTTDPEAE